MLTGCRVLVVEDDPETAILWTFVLENMRATVIGPFATADTALTALAGDAPDLALLDVPQNSADAYPVGHALVRHGIPFVLVSDGNPDNIPDALRRAPFLAKPASVRQLIEALESLSPTRNNPRQS
ncbi:hypothetical protein KPL74_08575 [Bacillus sp. NP157]|nr:hypothetical protein KPL74_08575 [Bacillus sp. NP157]